MVKDLVVTVDQEGAKMGVFLTLEPPTLGMVTQAAAAGFSQTDYGQFPKIQIVTIEELFGPSNPLHLPWEDTSVFKKAKRKSTQLDRNWIFDHDLTCCRLHSGHFYERRAVIVDRRAK